jgi:hypothetical protein
MADQSSAKAQLPDLVVRALEVLADLTAERFAARLGLNLGREYTSKNPPPDMSRRAFHDRCKRLAEAGVEGVRKRGRQWVAPRELIDELPVRRRAPVKLLSGPWSPQAALEAAGVRPQRK